MKPWNPETGSLDIATLRYLYANRLLTPTQLVELLFQRLEKSPLQNIWITLNSKDTLLASAQKLEAGPRDFSRFPLYGVPFAVKDNIDVAGFPTTAACKAYAHTPTATATIVEKLLAAGAFLVGKTNMDQFATGLTGVLSDFGPAQNPFNPAYISGGSSSGSAVAVSTGLASFSLGTDTAGSGRVPAGFNNIVGLKPTKGLIPTPGVLPACRSLDCLSIFALTTADTAEILALTKAYDRNDIYSRPEATALDLTALPIPLHSFRFGVPSDEYLDFLADPHAEALFQKAIARLTELGGRRIEIDFAPFKQAANLLYQGPWVAERLATLGTFLQTNPDSFHPVTRKIISGASRFSAADTFNATYELEIIKRRAADEWARMDIMLLPTTPTIFTIEEVQADPSAASTTLGRYTNFVNLLDTCAIALPAGFRGNGLPFGISLIAPAFQDARLLHLGTQYQTALGGTLGATNTAFASTKTEKSVKIGEKQVQISEKKARIAVVGAHLSGQPLNYQLTELGATLHASCRTAPVYRLFALQGTVPPKPGLVRDLKGVAIDVEVWEMPEQNVGAFLARVPAPLCIGTLALDNGDTVKGFLCESYVLSNAVDISHYGGWRSYLNHKEPVAI